jgi:di- and tripeptidase
MSNSDDDFASIYSSSNEYTCEQIKKQLMSKWRYPTLTVHKIDVSMDNKTIISHYASSAISMRIVPNQSIQTLCKNLTNYIYQSFEKLKSDNRIQVSIGIARENTV